MRDDLPADDHMAVYLRPRRPPSSTARVRLWAVRPLFRVLARVPASTEATFAVGSTRPAARAARARYAHMR